MSNQIRRKKVDVIEWVLNVKGRRNVSDTFSFQDRKCHLEFLVEQAYNIYFKSSGLLLPATVTVRVLSNSSDVGTPSTTYITAENQMIWSFPKGLPDILLNIEVTIEDDRSKDDKCIQTGSYLNSDLSAEGLNKDFSELLSTGLNHDVELKCGEESLKVHKIVLCARSGVFKAMLESDMEERRSGVVEIKDMDACYFQNFVRYLYTDVMPELTLDEATVLYEAGDKYGIRSLMSRCSEYLQDNLSKEHAFHCYVLADAHSDQKLKDKIISYILDEKMYLEDKYWSPFCQNYPQVVIEIYKLSYKTISKKE